MMSTENTGNKPDDITLAFWRAAEAGELHEVETLLSRVADLNARNEHGVTALMRAAQHGHAWVVRLLLAKGADANIVRNDKFTALSLAAFFGHTEVVRALMEHGADSKASTRHGTSPHMWATARTYSEIVDQLKTPAPPKREERAAIIPKTPKPVTPVPALAVNAPVTAAIVRTLKEPPEIWDLVHEEPKGFNARSAFVGHLRSMRLTFRIATAVGLVGACVVGVLILRGAQAHNEINAGRTIATQNSAVKVQTETTSLALPVVERATTAPAPPETAPVTPAATEDLKPATIATRSSHSRAVRAPRIELEPAAAPPAIENVQRIEAASEKSETTVRSEATSRPKISSPLSPQLITPAKTDSPKTKVIQWP